MMGVSEIKTKQVWQRPAFALALLPLLALAFNWPYLRGGFYADDILLLNILKQNPVPFSRWLGMWATPASGWGMLESMWWNDLTVTGEFGLFLRPLPSLIFEGSLRLFGEHAFPLHLLAILLHGGVAVSLYLLVRRLTNHHWLALFSGIFFVASEDHSMAVGWIAAITGPLAVQFIVLALLAHVHWLQRRKVWALIGSWLALMLALGCKESASTAAVGLVLLTFLMPSGYAHDDVSRGGIRQKIMQGLHDPLSWIPAALIGLGYLALYKVWGFGNYVSLMYVSPLAAPLKFLARAIVHLPVMWLGTLSPVPLLFIVYLPDILPLFAILGTILFLLFCIALWPFRTRSLVQWALILYVVTLLPEMAFGASERGLYFPLVPGSILLALVAMTAGPLARRITEVKYLGTRWTKFMGWVIIIMVLIPGLLLSPSRPWLFIEGFEKPEKELRTAMPLIEQTGPEHVVILNSARFMNTVYIWDILNRLSAIPLDVQVLSSANGVFELEKTGDSSLVIRTDRAGWLSNLIAGLVRAKGTFTVGNCYTMPLFTATVLKITSNRKDVLEVQFDFTCSLDQPDVLFLRWDGTVYEPVDMAVLVTGQRIPLANTSNLWQ